MSEIAKLSDDFRKNGDEQGVASVPDGREDIRAPYSATTTAGIVSSLLHASGTGVHGSNSIAVSSSPNKKLLCAKVHDLHSAVFVG